MSKFDFVDAYKNIPATLADLRLQGFTWLGKFFVENNMTFGGETIGTKFRHCRSNNQRACSFEMRNSSEIGSQAAG